MTKVRRLVERLRAIEIHTLYRTSGMRQQFFSWKPKPGAEELIYAKLNGLCISMKATDYLRLPERIFRRREAEMSDKAMKLYKTLERDTLLPFVDGDIDAPTAAVLYK